MVVAREQRRRRDYINASSLVTFRTYRSSLSSGPFSGEPGIVTDAERALLEAVRSTLNLQR